MALAKDRLRTEGRRFPRLPLRSSQAPLGPCLRSCEAWIVGGVGTRPLALLEIRENRLCLPHLEPAGLPPLAVASPASKRSGGLSLEYDGRETARTPAEARITSAPGLISATELST